MAAYTNVALAQGANLPDYLSNLSSVITKVSDTEISIGGKVSITFTWSGGNLTFTVSINGNSIFTYSNRYDYYPDALNLEAAISEDFVYLQCYWRDRTGGGVITPANYCTIVVATDGNNNYFAGGIGGSEDIYSLNLYGEDGTNGYIIPKMINFAAPAGQIGYSNIAPIANGGSLAFYASDLLSCTTVSKGNNIALPNGKTYIALGSNTMVEIDA